MNRTLIIQSAPGNAPEWIFECMHTVRSWAHVHGHEYRFFGDEIFLRAPEFRGAPFSKVTISDLCRLRLIQESLSLGCYGAVYWIDADFLIWNRRAFKLPEISPGEVACPREAWVYDAGNVALRWNNSIVGFCDREDASLLAKHSSAILISHAAHAVKETIIGTDLFSDRSFPLRKVEIKQAATLSPESIRRVLGPWIAGRKHLQFLSKAHGAQIHGANLCSSQKPRSGDMERLVHDLIQRPHFHQAEHPILSWIFRGFLKLCNLPDCMRCWGITRMRSIRRMVSGLT